MKFDLAIGTTIGHEITHGFDEMRRYLDKDRRNFTVWSNETTEIYNKRSKCLIDQYNNYTISQINRTVRSKFKEKHSNYAFISGRWKQYTR